MSTNNYANYFTRIIAHVIDGLILSLSRYCIWFGITYFVQVYSFFAFSKLITFPTQSYFLIADAYISIILPIAYFSVFESTRLQATPGKMLFRMKVVDMNEQRIAPLRAFGRFIASIVSTLSIVGLLIAFFTKKRQTLHDLVSKTMVIQT